MQLAFGVFAIAIATASFPAMSEQASRGEWAKFKETWRYSFRLTMFITIPAALGLAAIALPMFGSVFAWSVYLVDATITAYTAMAFARVSWPWQPYVMLFKHFALEDTKTPVKVATVILL